MFNDTIWGMKYILLILLALLQIVLAVIFRYKKHSRVSRVFFYFVTTISIWTASNAILDYSQYEVKASTTVLTVINMLCFFMGALAMMFIHRLSMAFPIERKDTKLTKTMMQIGWIVPIVSALPIVSGRFTIGSGGVINYKLGPYIAVLGAYIALIIILSILNIAQGYKNAERHIRRQVVTLFSGLITSVLVAVLFILILPASTNSQSWYLYGYYAPFIFTITMTYSIFRQGFLDFRLLVARAIGYLLSVGSLAALYGVLSFTFVDKLITGLNASLAFKQVAYTVLAVAMAFAFQPLKRQFDKITNSLFYRDAYEPQDLFDQLNRLLVSTLDLDRLLHGISDLIGKTLKSGYCVVALKGGDGHGPRVVGTKDLSGLLSNIDVARKLTVQYHGSVIVADMLDEKYVDLKKLMLDNDVAIIVRLSPDVRKTAEGLGYLLLGAKKSGNPYSSQDMRVLDTVANELIIAIQNALHYEEVQNFNKTLQSQVDDATRKLRGTNAKLRALDETKDDFISMASHQLRTPLTSIKGYLSMVLEGDAGKLNEQQQQMLQQSFVSSQRMVYLISDLLNLSRLNTGKFVIEPTPVNLADAVEQEVGQLTETAKARGIDLIYRKPATFPSVMLDETKTHQVIMNFMDNAVYYTPQGGKIEVSVTETPTAVEYRVKDNGIGVPKAERPHLFTKFYRAKNARQARPDGTGLGLFMAKKVIIAQGGSIIFDSEEGKGSTFGFAVPKKNHEVSRA